MVALPRGGSADRYAPDRLTGRQKVAIVCMAIGTEHAAKITAGLHPEEAEIVALEMAQLDRVPPATVDAVLAEWLELTLGVDSLSAGGVEFAKAVLEAAFGPIKAQAILKRIQGQLADSDRFGRLRRADPQQLGNTLRGEHPQTIALILAHLDAGHVAAILRELDPSLGGDVMYRIAKMEMIGMRAWKRTDRHFALAGSKFGCIGKNRKSLHQSERAQLQRIEFQRIVFRRHDRLLP